MREASGAKVSIDVWVLVAAIAIAVYVGVLMFLVGPSAAWTMITKLAPLAFPILGLAIVPFAFLAFQVLGKKQPARSMRVGTILVSAITLLGIWLLSELALCC